jgi:hypothetical protein
LPLVADLRVWAALLDKSSASVKITTVSKVNWLSLASVSILAFALVAFVLFNFFKLSRESQKRVFASTDRPPISLNRSLVQGAFQNQIYGFLPNSVSVIGRKIRTGVLTELDSFFEEHQVDFVNSDQKIIKRINVLFLPTPVRDSKSAPTVLFMNKCGNQELFLSPKIKATMTRFYKSICDEKMQARGWRQGFWSAETFLRHGINVITFHEGEAASDQPQQFQTELNFLITNGLINTSKAKPGLLSVWAWAQSRVLDYVILEKLVEPTKIGILGHSRRGKTALLASATDQRWAFTIAHQSGTLGAASLNRAVLESKGQITRTFPHWFTPGLVRLNIRQLSFEQKDLIGLIAPRPVMISEGFRDLWASPLNSAETVRLARRDYYSNQPSKILFNIQNYEHEINSDYASTFAKFINDQF